MHAIKFLLLHTIFTLLVVTPLASEKGNKDDNIHKERSSKKLDPMKRVGYDCGFLSARTKWSGLGIGGETDICCYNA